MFLDRRLDRALIDEQQRRVVAPYRGDERSYRRDHYDDDDRTAVPITSASAAAAAPGRAVRLRRGSSRSLETHVERRRPSGDWASDSGPPPSSVSSHRCHRHPTSAGTRSPRCRHRVRVESELRSRALAPGHAAPTIDPERHLCFEAAASRRSFPRTHPLTGGVRAAITSASVTTAVKPITTRPGMRSPHRRRRRSCGSATASSRRRHRSTGGRARPPRSPSVAQGDEDGTAAGDEPRRRRHAPCRRRHPGSVRSGAAASGAAHKKGQSTKARIARSRPHCRR